MPGATEIIRDMLKDSGIEHQYNEEEKSVSFKVDDMCDVEVHKHAYVAGYSIRTKCNMGENRKVESSASFIDRLMVIKDKESFYLYGISNSAALNAGMVETKTLVKKEPKDSGKFYIKCEKNYGYECELEKSEH